MLKKLVIGVLLLIAAILIYAATKPDTFSVQRSISIKASPEKIFPLINDFHAWDAWTPFNKDPAMKKTFSGANSGKGAKYAWEGNSEVGAGSVSITESLPPAKVALNLDMLKPFEGHNQVEFTLAAEGDVTHVTWAMRGHQPYLGKVISTFIDCDKMIGKDFETGLANLKALAEKT
jgi:polyketide cyclase/dehydrase/lipid transport protein